MTRTTLTALLLLAVLAGCGQKGPLYLPGNPSEVRADPGAAETADEEDEAENTDER